MKKKKIALAICSILLQIILLFFWAMVLIETVCPIYRLTYTLGVVAPNIGSNITVSAPQRVETFLTPSAEKANNQQFAAQSCSVQSTFVTTYHLQTAPQYTVLEKSRDVLVYELSSEEQPQKWIVTTYFGAENAFDMSVTEIGGEAK
ncbi:MAG: hypothetical protein ACI4K6_05505 [Candidatus Fimenecus sp.]